MNTRFAAIAGTLLVGISLFVTSLISQNLTNSALTSSSEAQEVSCSIRGTVRQRNLGDGTRCFFYYGTCRKDGVGTPIRTNCYGSREEAQAAAQTTCCGEGSAPSATPIPTSTTAPGQPSPTPIPGSCNGTGEYPGKACGEDGFTCCPGLFCTNGENGGPAKCGPKPTTPYCDPQGFYEGKTCAQLNCCSKKCDVVTDGVYCGKIPTAAPSPTPTIRLDLNSCYNERCKFQNGNPTCSNGRTCVVIGAGAQPPTEEVCDLGANCRCVLNVKCALPGGYEPGNKEKESCWCLNPGKCVPVDGNWEDYSCLNDVKCKLIDPTFKCIGAGTDPSGRPIFGTCGNDYCPDPTPTPTAVPRPGFISQPSVPVTQRYPYLLRIDREELPRYILRAIGLQ